MEIISIENRTKFQITVNEIERVALSEAVNEYYHNVSKSRLPKAKTISPIALEMHSAIDRMRKVL